MFRVRTALYLPLLAVLSGMLIGCPQSTEQIALMVSPEVLDFGLTGTSQTFQVRKVFTARPMPPFKVSSGASWISASPTTGQSSGPADPVTVTVTIDRSRLTSTANTAMVTIAAEGVPRKTVEVRARLALVAQFSAERTVAFQGEGIQFFDQSATSGGGEITSWLWDFGDGTTSAEQNPTKAYAEAGTYSVSLTVGNDTTSHTQTREDYVTVLPVTPPKADFRAEPTAATVGDPVRFIDMSQAGTNPITAWFWEFGDGQTSSERAPEHVYEEPGVFTVRLTVSSEGLSDTAVKEDYVAVAAAASGVGPTAEFEGAPRVVAEGGTVQFTDLSAPGDRPIVTWLWTFGDGASSSDRNPSHIYETAGTYSVTLNVFDEVFGDTAVKDGYIEVLAPPHADFSASKTEVEVNEVVAFTDLSTPGSDAITSWLWDFGDGATSTLRNPEHAYAAPGQYTVSLTVQAGELTDTMERTAHITVREPTLPTAEFSADKQLVVVNQLILFMDRSVAGTFAIDRWAWDFGDGDTSAERNPAHRYADPGLYTVRLTVFDEGGYEDTIAKQQYVEVVAPLQANFEADKVDVEVNEEIQFTDLSTPGLSPITRWRWSFGDGVTSGQRNPTHAYTEAGEYTVSLTVEAGGQTSTLDRAAYIRVTQPAPPTAEFSANTRQALVNEPVQFINETVEGDYPVTAWFWDFGDGATSTERDPEHRYAELGTYTVSLTALDEAGYDDTVVKNDYIEAVPPLDAEFNGDPLVVESGGAVQFTDLSTPGPNDEITEWEWDFGDETGPALGPNPLHVYTLQGTEVAEVMYSVQLTISTSLGNVDVELKPDYVTVVEAAGEEAAAFVVHYPWNAPEKWFVVGDEVSVTNLSDAPGEGLRHQWRFGDGTSSSEVHPVHVYERDSGDGSVPIQLEVVAPSKGEPATAEERIRVFARTPLDDAVDGRDLADGFAFVEEIETGDATYRAYAFRAADGAGMTVVTPESVNGPTALLILADMTAGPVDLAQLGQAATAGRCVTALVDTAGAAGIDGVVRVAAAMDAVEAFASGDAEPVRTFIPVGAGEAGRTAWLAAAADQRVRAIAPVGFDVEAGAGMLPAEFGEADYAARVMAPVVRLGDAGGAVYLPESGLFYIDASVNAMLAD